MYSNEDDEMWDDNVAYLANRTNAYTSGLGHGRQENPRGKDGKIMTCHKCGSPKHFADKCDQSSSHFTRGSQHTHTTHFFKGKGKSKGHKGRRHFFVEPYSTQPVQQGMAQPENVPLPPGAIGPQDWGVQQAAAAGTVVPLSLIHI